MRLPEFSKPAESRSRNMRAIRSSGNQTTEKRFVALLRESRIKGWRSHPQHVLGNPDFVFPAARLAVFVDGCFWHGCPKCGHIPKTNRAYWKAKIARNLCRDSMINRELHAAGFRVVRLRECDLRKRPGLCLRRLHRTLAMEPQEKEGA
jgi:DNA mismatch endonuclease (patch repair protein)